jgi:5-methylcytosine-specific restriction endonuclease McrA
VGSSSRPDGSRRLYNEFWSAQVPLKVRIFGWRLSQEGLSTQCNRKYRKLTEEATCQICGALEESGHHVVIQCTKARALRKEMHKLWELPGEEHFQNTEPDWLLLLLQKVNKVAGARILLLLGGRGT